MPVKKSRASLAPTRLAKPCGTSNDTVSVFSSSAGASYFSAISAAEFGQTLSVPGTAKPQATPSDGAPASSAGTARTF